MNIAGFNVTKKALVIIGGIVLFIVALIIGNHLKEEQDFQRRQEEARREQEEALKAANNTSEPIDYDEQLQQSYREKYGEPPEGFKWDAMGNLVAVGTSDMTAEDIVYTFVRSLSMLDFSTAQKYSLESSVIETYQDYYGEVSKNITDYYDNFLRKQYKLSLTTLELDGVDDVAVFADGTENVTLNIKVLDLTNKDFWQKDRDEIFETLKTFSRTESDDTKKEQYIYDYILKAYENGDVGKRDVTVELVVGKDNGGGWLVTNDGELNSTLSYTWGVNVANYIQSQYQDWLYSNR